LHFNLNNSCRIPIKSKGQFDSANAIKGTIKFVDTLAALFALISACLCYMENEKYRDTVITKTVKQSKYVSLNETQMRTINIFLVLGLCKKYAFVKFISIGCLIITHYFLKLRLQKAELKLKPYDTLYTSGLYKLFIIELVVCALFDPPNVNSIFTGKMLGGKYTYSLDDMMVVISLAKCYTALRLYYHYSKWTTYKVQSLTKRYNVKNLNLFPFKCELKYRPFLFLLCVTFVTVIFISIIIRVVEM
jgi:hypothetical protein